MVSFEEARSIILDSVQTVGTERIHLLEATGRVLAEDAAAPWDLPLWDNSAMDGYAVRAEDCLTTPCRLRVTGFLPAGARADGITVEAGCAVRIMTGAPTPAGCDAVIPLEETDDGQEEVTLLEPVKILDGIVETVRVVHPKAGDASLPDEPEDECVGRRKDRRILHAEGPEAVYIEEPAIVYLLGRHPPV